MSRKITRVNNNGDEAWEEVDVADEKQLNVGLLKKQMDDKSLAFSSVVGDKYAAIGAKLRKLANNVTVPGSIFKALAAAKGNKFEKGAKNPFFTTVETWLLKPAAKKPLKVIVDDDDDDLTNDKPKPKSKSKSKPKPASNFVHRMFATAKGLLDELERHLGHARGKNTTTKQYETAKQKLEKVIEDTKRYRKTKIPDFIMDLVGKTKGGLLNSPAHPFFETFRKWDKSLKDFTRKSSEPDEARLFFEELLLVAPVPASLVEYVTSNAENLFPLFIQAANKSGWKRLDTESLIASHISGHVTKGEATYISKVAKKCLQDAVKTAMMHDFSKLMKAYDSLAGPEKAGALKKRLPDYVRKGENSTLADLQKSLHWIEKLTDVLIEEKKPNNADGKKKKAPRKPSAAELKEYRDLVDEYCVSAGLAKMPANCTPPFALNAGHSKTDLAKSMRWISKLIEEFPLKKKMRDEVEELTLIFNTVDDDTVDLPDMYRSRNICRTTLSEYKKIIAFLTRVIKQKGGAIPEVHAKGKAASAAGKTLKDASPVLIAKGAVNNPALKALVKQAPNLLLPAYFQKMTRSSVRKLKATEIERFDAWVTIMRRVEAEPIKEYPTVLALLPASLRDWLEDMETLNIPLNVLGCAVLHFDPGFSDFTTASEKKECKKHVIHTWAEKYITKDVTRVIESFEWDEHVLKKVPAFKNIKVQVADTAETSNIVNFNAAAGASLQDKLKCAQWIKKQIPEDDAEISNPVCVQGKVELACKATASGRHYAVLRGKRVYLD